MQIYELLIKKRKLINMAKLNEYLQALFAFRLYCHGLVMCGAACSIFISANISRRMRFVALRMREGK